MRSYPNSPQRKVWLREAEVKRHITATPQVTEYRDWTSQLPGPAVLPTYLENISDSKSFSDQLSNAEECSSEPEEGFPFPSVVKIHCILSSPLATWRCQQAHNSSAVQLALRSYICRGWQADNCTHREPGWDPLAIVWRLRKTMTVLTRHGISLPDLHQ